MSDSPVLDDTDPRDTVYLASKVGRSGPLHAFTTPEAHDAYLKSMSMTEEEVFDWDVRTMADGYSYENCVFVIRDKDGGTVHGVYSNTETAEYMEEAMIEEAEGKPKGTTISRLYIEAVRVKG